MTNPLVNDDHKPTLVSEQPRSVYHRPMVTLLDDYDIASGISNIPENNNGLLES